MEVVFFIYGLAFFLLGFAILIYPTKGSSYDLSKSIKFIAWFGILHGINEWLDLFLLIEHFSNPFPIKIIRAGTLPLSFIFLVYFGSKVLASHSPKPNFYRHIPLISGLIWAVVFLVSSYAMLMRQDWEQSLLMLSENHRMCH